LTGKNYKTTTSFHGFFEDRFRTDQNNSGQVRLSALTITIGCVIFIYPDNTGEARGIFQV
jgi:hypothetical protein